MKRTVLLTLCAMLLCLPLMSMAEDTGRESAAPALTQEERAAERAERQARKQNRQAQQAAAADLRASIDAKHAELNTIRDKNRALQEANRAALKAARTGKSSLTPEQEQTLSQLDAQLQELRNTRRADREAMIKLVKQAKACLQGEDTAATQAAYQAILDKLNARCDQRADISNLLEEISALLQTASAPAAE